ncbi:hypothetical protein L917_18780, partial [Phytophthora nicotianae]
LGEGLVAQERENRFVDRFIGDAKGTDLLGCNFIALLYLGAFLVMTRDPSSSELIVTIRANGSRFCGFCLSWIPLVIVVVLVLRHDYVPTSTFCRFFDCVFDGSF